MLSSPVILFFILLLPVLIYPQSYPVCYSTCTSSSVSTPCSCLTGRYPPSVPATCCGNNSTFFESTSSIVTLNLIISPANGSSEISAQDAGTAILNAYIAATLTVGWPLYSLYDYNNPPATATGTTTGTGTNSGTQSTTTGTGSGTQTTTTTGTGGDGGGGDGTATTTTTTGGGTSDGVGLYFSNWISTIQSVLENTVAAVKKNNNKNIHPRQTTAMLNPEGQSIITFQLNTYQVAFNEKLFRFIISQVVTGIIGGGLTLQYDTRLTTDSISGGVGDSTFFGVVGQILQPTGDPAPSFTVCFLQFNSTNGVQGPNTGDTVSGWTGGLEVVEVSPTGGNGIIQATFRGTVQSTMGLSCRLIQEAQNEDAYVDVTVTQNGVGTFYIAQVQMTQQNGK